MATDTQEPKELHIQEGDDGSAVVELPEGIEPVDLPEETPQEPAAPVEKAEGGNVDEDEDHPDDTEAVRAARRARRRAKKDLIRKTNEEKDMRLTQLQRENEEFKRRLADVEQRTRRSDIAQVDKVIDDFQVRVEFAKMKLMEATNANDGQAMVEAQQMWRDAERELERAQGYKTQLERQAEQRPQHRDDIQVPDVRVQRNAVTWMERNKWYKPDTSDVDSKIAKQMDEALISEGWDPTSPDYWDELDNRLQKYLPHRYNSNNNGNSSVRTPRNVVGSSGREASAAYGGSNKNTFTLSPERVRAMKESGAWDNPERRRKMTEYYMQHDRNNRK